MYQFEKTAKENELIRGRSGSSSVSGCEKDKMGTQIRENGF